MKSLRITQWSLRQRPTRHFKYSPCPELQVEVSPKSEYKEQLGLGQSRNPRYLRFLKMFLPEGYPDSVHCNYLPFAFWSTIQSISTSFIGVLSTQAMLGTLISLSPGSGGGWLGHGAASATINWVLKDGLGQAGGIILVSILGNKLDCHARSLRFYSSSLFLVGTLLELGIPWFSQSHLLPPSAAFLTLAAGGNVLKNLSWMLGSATRAHFLRHFALRGNLGDLTGKSGSQMTLATLLGTSLGLLILRCESFNVLMTGWMGGAILTLWTSWKACRVAFSRSLELNRLVLLLEALSNNKDKGGHNVLSRYILTPELVSSKESILKFPSTANVPVEWNPSLDVLNSLNLRWLIPMDSLSSANYCLAQNTATGSFYLWSTNRATSADRLRAVIEVLCRWMKIDLGVDVDFSVDDVIEALKRQGWDVDHFTGPKELEDPHRVIELLD